MASARPAGTFGTDAPWVPWMWWGFALAYAVLTVLSGTLWHGPAWLTALLAVLTLCWLAGGALFLYASKRGKFEVWRELLDRATPPGTVLDVGCGHGAVSIMTAQRFPGARVEGIDLWRSVDQSGNSPEAAEANARANGVEARVRFTTGDMRALPYPDAAFDLVTASLAIHNLRTAQDRERAVDEAWRVLAPGGELLVLDISRTAEYVRRLGALGAQGMTQADAGWRVWWSGPWMATRVVTATKPAADI